MPDLTAKQKFFVLKEAGKANSEIARELGAPDRTIRDWARKYKKGTLLDIAKRSGRPPIATARDLRLLRREVKRDGIRKIHDIVRDMGLKVCDKTARSMARKCGLSYLSRPKVANISMVNRRKRMNWCDFHKNLTNSFWDGVVWSDETTICVGGGNGPTKSWTTQEWKFEGNNPRSYVKFGGLKKMFWGCFTSRGTGLLIPIEGNMKAKDYVKLLQEHVLPWIREQEALLKVKLVFQQDNARPHTAAITRRFFAENQLDVLDWPASSPDLNPIENMWAILKRRLGAKLLSVSSSEDLISTALDNWGEFSGTECSNCVRNMPERIEAVMKAKGGPTRY